jgi:NitT/TauT family transport system substrate-binding protein
MITRREFLRDAALAGAAGALGLVSEAIAAEPPPETKRLRMVQIPTICQAPQFVAEELLRGEGFTDLQFVRKQGTQGIEAALAAGEADINMHFAAPTLVRLDAGDPIVILAGGHIGCFELFGGERVRAIRDLKGRTVAIPLMGSAEHVFLASMVAHVGLDPRKDIHWVSHTFEETMRLLSGGKVDAYLALPPRAQELRARKIGQVVVNSSVDRPWSQYFCCLILGNRKFVQKHPVAARRALRAILKAADLCASDPERAARFMVDRGFTARYDYALESVRGLSYGKWRDYNPEDTVRFYGLRLQEAGLIKSSPKKILAEGADWRFFNELKRELKS